jgi:hypothetical protein
MTSSKVPRPPGERDVGVAELVEPALAAGHVVLDEDLAELGVKIAAGAEVLEDDRPDRSSGAEAAVAGGLHETGRAAAVDLNPTPAGRWRRRARSRPFCRCSATRSLELA